MTIRIVVIVLVLFGGIAKSLATDIFVNNVAGDDRFNGLPSTEGGENAGSVRTITRALELALPGDRIVVEKTDLPYHESLTLDGPRLSGTMTRPLRIISNGAILDGTAPVRPSAWEHVEGEVFRFQPDLKSHQQLYLDDRPAVRITWEGKRLPDLEPLQWALKDGWIYFRVEPGKIPGQYALRHCIHQAGITLYQVEHIVISGLVIQGFQLDGINAHDGVERTVMTRCKLRGNGRSGLSAGGTSHVQLDQSLIGNNGAAQVRSEGRADVLITDCRILESESFGPGMVRTGGQISVDGEVIR